MTRRRTRATTPAADIELARLPEDTPVPAGYTTLSPTEERRERELEDILAEIGTDARLKVWQSIDGKSSYAGDMSADGFTLDALLDAFGGGDKTIVIMQGKTRVDKFTVSLDPSIPPKNPRTPKGVTTPANGSSPDLTSVFAMMAKNSMDQAQMMTTMMGGIVGAMTTVMQATGRTDPIAQAIQIATVLKPGNDRNSVTEAMTMFREGMQLAERYAGKDEGDGVMDVVSKGMDTLALVVNGMVNERKTKAAQAAIEAARRIPATTGDGNPPGVGGSDSGGGDAGGTSGGGMVAPGVPGETAMSIRPWVDAVRPHIGKLLAASSFLTPSAAADTIQHHLSDDQFDDLLNDIEDQSNGGFGSRMRDYFPADIDKANPEWIGQTLQILLDEYAATDEDSDTPPVAP